MKIASISQVKNGLSSFVDRVRAGESILVTDRGVVVARLEPAGAGPGPGGRLERLERAGLVRVGRSAPPVELIRSPAPRAAPGLSVAQMLLDERSDGR
jgi:prevent-host-death family protein